MIVIFLVYLASCAYSVRLRKADGISDYLGHSDTKAVNGFFTGLIILRHSCQYIEFNGIIDSMYSVIDSYIGQLVVVSFLFFSGYGVSKSIVEKENYVKRMPKNRILKVLLSFQSAVLLYLILDIILGINYDLKTILLSFFAVKSIGNSEWYIFAILCMYIFSYIGYRFFKNTKPLLAVFIMTCAYIALMYKLRPVYWYSNVICYLFGMIFCQYKEKTDEIISRFGLIKIIILLAAGFALLKFCSLYIGRFAFVLEEIYSIIFSMLIICLLKIFVLSQKRGIMTLFGDHAFSIFILQRIPMIIMSELHINKIGWLFVLLSVILSVLLAVLFDKAQYVVFKKLKI